MTYLTQRILQKPIIRSQLVRLAFISSVLIAFQATCLHGVLAQQTNTFPSTGNVGIGTTNPQDLFHIAGSGGVGFTIDTPGTAKARVMSVPNVWNWMGTTLNAKYTTSGWNLDDTAADGWFFKLDARGGAGNANDNNGMWLFRVPAGANPHVNEYPVFGVTADRGAIGKLGVSYIPTSTLDIKSAGNTSASSSLSVKNSSAITTLFVRDDGHIGIGTTNPVEKLEVLGNIKVTATGIGTGNITAAGTIEANIINAKYQDVAEWVPASEQIPTGTVVVLDSTKSNHVIASTRGYDTRVAGVISEQPGITLGESGDNKVLVATTGRVRIKVDATRGPIQIGDLLVTSDVPGLAMKSEPIKVGGRLMHMPGTLIGKALEPLESGSGKILVLLSLQ